MAIRVLMLTVFLGLVGSVGYFAYHQIRSDTVCDVCHRSLHHGNAYRVHLEDGSVNESCCPRCGLRFQAGRTDVVSTEVTDFDRGETVDASRALFVEDSSVSLCHDKMVEEDRSGNQYQLTWDRCLPSLIAFKERGAAEAFRRDYGGTIKTYGELLEEEL